jgi:hypothetical protein
LPDVVHEEGQDQPVINCLEKHIKMEVHRKPPDPNAEVENEVPGKKIAAPKSPQ